jgi:phosphoribosyl-AMP cyclohydrolase / phosphoribosyl-ATP pyrophosphohydrolase
MKLNFDKGNGLIPAVVQDDRTGKVLMVGYMDKAALKMTRKDGRVTFYSRSKQRLWIKGETSGNYLSCREILPDCDGDTLLIKAVPSGPACHKGWDTCFKEKNENMPNFLFELEKIIKDRQQHPQTGSYTTNLFEQGLSRIAQKVGEEAVETVLAAVSRQNEQLKEEVSDLLYHLLVLLAARKISLEQILVTLTGRHVKASRK